MKCQIRVDKNSFTWFTHKTQLVKRKTSTHHNTLTQNTYHIKNKQMQQTHAIKTHNNTNNKS